MTYLLLHFPLVMALLALALIASSALALFAYLFAQSLNFFYACWQPLHLTRHDHRSVWRTAFRAAHRKFAFRFTDLYYTALVRLHIVR